MAGARGRGRRRGKPVSGSDVSVSDNVVTGNKDRGGRKAVIVAECKGAITRSRARQEELGKLEGQQAEQEKEQEKEKRKKQAEQEKQEQEQEKGKHKKEAEQEEKEEQEKEKGKSKKQTEQKEHEQEEKGRRKKQVVQEEQEQDEGKKQSTKTSAKRRVEEQHEVTGVANKKTCHVTKKDHDHIRDTENENMDGMEVVASGQGRRTCQNTNFFSNKPYDYYFCTWREVKESH